MSRSASASERRWTGRSGRSLRRQRGAVPVEWALGLGLLVLPVAMLVAVFPEWAERQAVARVAAREAARVAALATDPAAGEAAGAALAHRIAANHGIAPGEVAADVHVPADAAGAPLRDGVVTATVEVTVPLVAVPLAGRAGGWTWTVTHSHPLDRYRSLPP